MLYWTWPLWIVFGGLTVLAVKYDKARIHHVVIAILFGIGIGASAYGGEVNAGIVWAWRALSQLGTQAG